MSLLSAVYSCRWLDVNLHSIAIVMWKLRRETPTPLVHSSREDRTTDYFVQGVETLGGQASLWAPRRYDRVS